MTRQEEHDVRRKLKVLRRGEESGNVSHTCRFFGISRDTYYRWKRSYDDSGESGLINSKPCPTNPKLRVPPHIEEKLLYVRREFGLGQMRIKWYLERYFDIEVSAGGVYQVLKRHGVNRLPPGAPKRSPSTLKRYEKDVPGHHVQVDVKFLIFKDKNGRTVAVVNGTNTLR